MQLHDASVVVSGGASGLGLATAARLSKTGADVTVVDLPTPHGAKLAADLGVRFQPADVTDEDQLAAAFDEAERYRPLRALVHTAGRGARIRVLDREGRPGDVTEFEAVLRLNVVGSFNALLLAAERMARNELVDDERGVVIMTASVAAYEGQIGQ